MKSTWNSSTAWSTPNRVRKPEWRDKEPPKVKELLKNLSPEQVEVVAEMLEGARTSAIHDVLVYLEWKYQISRNEVVIDPDSFNHYSTLHHDYMARLMGDPWTS
ncbi:MAG: hypothetical protein AMXMBFR33_48690 [Candidatus Xenobia bacterium]